MSCVGTICITQFLLAMGIATDIIPAGPPTLAAIVAILIFLQGLFITGAIK